MPVRAKRKPKSSGRDKGRHVSPKLQLHIPRALRVVRERSQRETKPRPTVAAIVRLALEGFLQSRGYLPTDKQE